MISEPSLAAGWTPSQYPAGLVGTASADELLARRRAERSGRDPLTSREREIAGLLAKALTNRQIAADLVLSERTVESHVRNILSKLGFTGRPQIATWALSPAARGIAPTRSEHGVTPRP